MNSFSINLNMFERHKKAVLTFGFSARRKKPNGIGQFKKLVDEVMAYNEGVGYQATEAEISRVILSHPLTKKILEFSPKDCKEMSVAFRQALHINYQYECACCEKMVQGRISWSKALQVIALERSHKIIDVEEFMSITLSRSNGFRYKIESIEDALLVLSKKYPASYKPYTQPKLPANYFGLCSTCQKALYLLATSEPKLESLHLGAFGFVENKDFQIISAQLEPDHENESLSFIIDKLSQNGFEVVGSPAFHGSKVFQGMKRI